MVSAFNRITSHFFSQFPPGRREVITSPPQSHIPHKRDGGRSLSPLRLFVCGKSGQVC